jgi:hypothetical protein
MRKFFIAVTILMVMTSSITVFTNVEATTNQEKLLGLINEYRQKNNLPALTLRNDVSAVAQAHSKNMHDQNNLNHVLDGKNPSDRLNDAGIGFTAMVENVAFNKGYSDPIQTCFDGWVNSSGHNANMLSANVTHAGIGVFYSDSKGWWFTYLGIKPTGSDSGNPEPPPDPGQEEEEEDTQDINLSLKQGASTTYNITFSNTGNIALTMKVSLTKGSKWITVSPASVTIPVGKKQVFYVKISAFTDMTPGKFTDTINFSWNGGISKYVINLTVLQNPDLIKSDFLVTCPEMILVPFEAGLCTTVDLTVKNTGSTDINPTVSSYSNPSGLFKLFPDPAPKTGLIKPGQSVNLKVGIMMLKSTTVKNASAYFMLTDKTQKRTAKAVLTRDNSPMFIISGPQLIRMDFVGKSKTFNYTVTNTGKTKSTFDVEIYFDDYDFLSIDYSTTIDQTPIEPGKSALVKVTFNLLSKPNANIVNGYIKCNKTGNQTVKCLEFRLTK